MLEESSHTPSAESCIRQTLLALFSCRLFYSQSLSECISFLQMYTSRHGNHIKTTLLSHSFPFPFPTLFPLSNAPLSLYLNYFLAPPHPLAFLVAVPTYLSPSQQVRQPQHVCQAGKQVTCTTLEAVKKASSAAATERVCERESVEFHKLLWLLLRL